MDPTLSTFLSGRKQERSMVLAEHLDQQPGMCLDTQRSNPQIRSASPSKLAEPPQASGTKSQDEITHRALRHFLRANL